MNINNDGWANLLTKQGTAQDRTTNTRYMGEYDSPLSEKTLASIYRGDGIGRRIIDIPAQDMFRQWVTIKGDNRDIMRIFSSLRVRQSLLKAVRWARLFGGAVVLMGIDDGKTLDQPYIGTSRGGLKFLTVYDRFKVWQDTSRKLIDDPNSMNYGECEYFNVSPTYGASFVVHRSRLLIIDGEDTPDVFRTKNNGWGDSVLLPVYSALRDLGTAMNASANIIHDFIQATLSIDNLAEMIASGQEDLIRKRLEILDMSKSVLNTMILNTGETYNKQASSVAGLPDLIDRFSLMCSATSGIPATKLFGRSPAGLNSTGESDIRNYYDDVKSEQEDKLRPTLETILAVIANSNQVSKSVKISDLAIEFNPLWQLDETQTIDLRYKQAQQDEIYIRNQVLTPEEVAISRFGNTSYSTDTQLMQDERNGNQADTRSEG